MSGERGQALVEFALVLPLLLAFALAIATVSEIGIARLALQHAAAEGARIGALTNEDDRIRATVAESVAPLDPASVRIQIEPTEDEPPRDDDPRETLLRVTLRYDARAPLGLLGLGGLALRSSAVRVIEWTP